VRPKILAYYFPSWHADEKNEQWFGTGWTEWDLLRSAGPRFDGHRQPRVPALGYTDQADPAAMAVDIDLAADHGVDAFLFDFYWHEDGPFLNRELDEGFLGAANRPRLEFALMWANHNWVDIFPAGADNDHRMLEEGTVGRAAFDAMTDRIVEHYFSQPEYLKVEGHPFFSIYEIGSLVRGLGGIEATRAALADFTRKAVAAGHPGIHFDAVVWGFAVLPLAVTVGEPAEVIAQLELSSASSYVWIHHVDLGDVGFPRADWVAVRDGAFAEYEVYNQSMGVPFYPNVTVGWDSSPRTEQTADFAYRGYPWYPVLDASPAEFRAGLETARAFAHEHSTPFVTINAWNEWTEGSALLPDTTHGLAYLEALREVFGIAPSTP